MKLPKLTAEDQSPGFKLILIFREKRRGAGRKPGPSPEAAAVSPPSSKYRHVTAKAQHCPRQAAAHPNRPRAGKRLQKPERHGGDPAGQERDAGEDEQRAHGLLDRAEMRAHPLHQEP